MVHEKMQTTSTLGLREDSMPFRLYQKAKKFGIWNPCDIDFSQDIEDWKKMTEPQRENILQLISQFQAGEEAVTLDLLPLIMAVAKEGRIEEEMYLTTFLFEEAKHTEFFRIFLNTIGETGDLTVHHSDKFKEVFYEMLPTAMEKLLTDTSPEAIAEASTVYNMFIEAVLAETAYFGIHNSLEKSGLMPGLTKGMSLIKRDESRHIAYGTFLIQRIICEHPHIYDLVAQKMGELTPYAIQLNKEGTKNSEEHPFGVDPDASMNFTMRQLSLRMEILSRARGKKIEEVYKSEISDYGVQEEVEV